MPDAEREREDVGVAYEDSTGFRRLDCDAGQGDVGCGLWRTYGPMDGHRLHLRNSTRSTILGMALNVVAGHVSEDTDSRLDGGVATLERKPDDLPPKWFRLL